MPTDIKIVLLFAYNRIIELADISLNIPRGGRGGAVPSDTDPSRDAVQYGSTHVILHAATKANNRRRIIPENFKFNFKPIFLGRK